MRAEIKWIEEPLSKIAYVRGSTQNKAMRIALNKAASVVKTEVANQAPKALGNLAKSIRIKTKYYKAKSIWAAIVGPSRNFSKGGPKIKKGQDAGLRKLIRPARYAHLVQFGTKKAPANPFLTRAHDATRQVFFDLLRSKLNEQLEAILRTKV